MSFWADLQNPGKTRCKSRSECDLVMENLAGERISTAHITGPQFDLGAYKWVVLRAVTDIDSTAFSTNLMLPLCEAPAPCTYTGAQMRLKLALSWT